MKRRLLAPPLLLLAADASKNPPFARPASSTSDPAGSAPFAVAVPDLHRDGKPGLAVANYSGQLSDPGGGGSTFLLNQGRGRFRLGPFIETGRASSDVATGDGDGYRDAITAKTDESSISILSTR